RVEEVRALGGEVAERARQIALYQRLAERRRAVTGAKHAVPLGVGRGLLELVDALARERRGRTPFRVMDGRLEERGERSRAEALEQHRPPAHAARHAHGHGADDRKRARPATLQLLERGT